MPNVPVVAEAASPLNHLDNQPASACAYCGQAASGLLSRHVCASCGKPQPLNPREDYFTFFGVPKKFAQDRKELERRFYEISRALHPDRFSTASSAEKSASLERMSYLNQAYQTLKDPVLLRNYFLESEGLITREGGASAKPQVPAEIAETWFELQDALMEDPAQARIKLKEFEGSLGELKERDEKAIAETEAELDRVLATGRNADKSLYERLSKQVHSQSYLKSMERDVERIKKKWQG